MARRKTNDPFNSLTVSEPLSTTLRDGRTIHGTLWMHASGSGSFQVEYRGDRKTDGRSHYTNAGEIRGIARLILAEMAQDSQ